MLNGTQPHIFEDGEQMRDFVHVKDIVRANILAMESPKSDGQVINVGSGKPITIRQVADILARSLGMEVSPVISNKYRAGDVRHCYADITKARNLLGYEPKVTHEEGFRELAEWLRGQQAEDRADTMLKELNAYGLTA
jgi:dTDP-L-rhamnose 4-epimerase